MFNEMFLVTFEKKMLKEGYESFSLREKNDFISYLADKNGLKYSEVTDEFILEYHKKLKVDHFNECCEQDIVEGFTATNGHKYRANRDDQKNFFGKALEMMILPEKSTVQWKTEDVGYIDHTKEEWFSIFVQGVIHKESILHKYDTLKKEANDATTEEELLTIKWE